METIIKADNYRYLSEVIKELPFGIFNKVKTDVGGTYLAVNDEHDYIIVCPFKDLVDSIAKDKNNKYPVFKCYGGVKELDFIKYIEKAEIKKIAVTYDSFPKLLNWLGNDRNYRILVDEYHLILSEMDYRADAIDGLMNKIKEFSYYTFLSATPIDINFEIDFFKQLPHYKVEWNNYIKIKPYRLKTSNVNKALVKLINEFLDNGIYAPAIDGTLKKVEKIYIFLNSVTSIKQILDTLELEDDIVKICCADKIRNSKLLENYHISSISDEDKKINFFTKKGYQGCNLFTNNGLVIVASDAKKENTLTDISTTMEQISGRIRFNDEYQNCFRHILVHLYSTNCSLMTDTEFAIEMQKRVKERDLFLKAWKKLDYEEKSALISKSNIEDSIFSFIDNEVVPNPLKEQALYYKQQLRNCYRDGFSIRKAYENSEKFELTNQEYYKVFDIQLSKIVTISYQQLLKDYLDNPSAQYELEYPEFKDISKYLTLKEINSLRWNKDKLVKAVNDKKLLNKVFDSVYKEGFISSKILKEKFTTKFKELGIDITPKASLIEACRLYEVKKTQKREDGKVIQGYNIGLRYFYLPN